MLRGYLFSEARKNKIPTASAAAVMKPDLSLSQSSLVVVVVVVQ